MRKPVDTAVLPCERNCVFYDSIDSSIRLKLDRIVSFDAESESRDPESWFPQ